MVFSRQTWLRAVDVRFDAIGARSQSLAITSSFGPPRRWPKRWRCLSKPALNISGLATISSGLITIGLSGLLQSWHSEILLSRTRFNRALILCVRILFDI